LSQMTLKEKLSLIIAVIAGIGAITYLFVYRPVMDDVYKKEVGMRVIAAEVANKGVIMEELRLGSLELEETKAEINNIINSIPQLGDESEIIRQIYRITGVRGDMVNLNISDKVMVADIYENNIDVTITAEYAEFRSMVRHLEESFFKNKIKELSFELVGTVVDARMNITFFTHTPINIVEPPKQ